MSGTLNRHKPYSHSISSSPLDAVDVHVYSIPLRTKFRGITIREGMLLHGDHGWSEFSPFWDYDAPTSAPWLRCALDEATQNHTWPLLRDIIPVNVTIPAVGPERAFELVLEAAGCTTAKVKVAEPGQSEADEIARLEAVRAALGPTGNIRIDANGLWPLEVALQRLPLLDKAAGGLEYAEQPCASVTDLATLRLRGNVPIAADESIRRASDPLLVASLEAADLVVLKVQPLGGVASSLEIAAACGLPAIVSSALETSIGIASGLRLAAALPQLSGACGLATVHLFSGDVAASPLLPIDGCLTVPDHSFEPDPDLLLQHQAAPDRRAAWLQRMKDVADAL